MVREPIDAFILDTLEARRISPSPEADKRTLLRRLSLDLTGLPPSPAELDAFLRDDSAGAYERQVDRLLASPHYGERMAVPWLDAVRFADTVGYHGYQIQRDFPYRDYVVNSFNSDKPFDQFTIEQIAGDLLPNATTEQKIATGYNRLNMKTREGGAQPREYLAKYAADRVRTTAETWLGSTMGCCECHDHKFDPFLTKDFYAFEAFFADIKEQGVGVRETVMVPDDAQAAKIKSLEDKVTGLEKTVDTSTPALETAQTEWEKSLAAPQLILGDWFSSSPFPAKSLEAAYDTAFEPEKEVDLSKTNAPGGLKWTRQPSFK